MQAFANRCREMPNGQQLPACECRVWKRCQYDRSNAHHHNRDERSTKKA